MSDQKDLRDFPETGEQQTDHSQSDSMTDPVTTEFFDSLKKDDGDASIIRASWAGADIPDTWSAKTVGDHVEVQGGKAVSSDNFSKNAVNGLPLIKRKTVNNDTYPETRLTNEVESRYIIESGDVLVSMDRYFECILWSYDDAALNQRVCRLTPDGEFNGYFLMYSLQKPLTYLENLGGTTDFTSLSINEFDNIEIPTPPIPEQWKIATVLDTLDSLSEKYDQIITQLERTKKAVLQDLTTKGIGHDSYKKFNIGPREYNIPEGWDIVEFGDVFDTTRGVNYSSDNYVEAPEDGMIFLTLNAIKPGGGIKRDGLKYYDDDIKDKKKASSGDVLISNTDLNQDGKIIGYPVTVPDTEEVVSFSHHLLKLEPKMNIFSDNFLEYLLSTHYIHKRMRDISCGSTVLNLNSTLLQKIPLPVPSKEEQQRIADVLSEYDNLINNHNEIKDGIIATKQGLMQDLLSGTVRTTDTNIEVPEEITQHG